MNISKSQARRLRDQHPPGSDEAINAGCRCPVLDNAHGRGYMGGVQDPETGETVYVYNSECPLHAMPDQ